MERPSIYAWLIVVTIMTPLFASMCLPEVGPVPLVKHITLFFFRSTRAINFFLVLFTALHIGEAIYAWHLAKRVDPGNVRGWFWQTLGAGIFSLSLLLKKRARSGAKASLD